MLQIGPIEVLKDIFATGKNTEATSAQTWDYFFGTITPRMFHNVTSELLGPRLSTMIGVAIPAVPLAYALLRAKTLRKPLMLEAVALAYSFAFLILQIIFETNYNYARVFIPAISLIVIFSICGLYLIMQSLLEARVTRGYASVVATLLICATSAAVVAGYHPATYQHRVVSTSRHLYNALSHIVTFENRLLLPACSAEAAVDDGIGVTSNVYLGRRIVSLLATPIDDFNSFLAAHSIRYVLVPRGFGISAITLDDLRRLFSVFYGAEVPANVERSLADAGPAVFPPGTVNWTLEACKFEAEMLRRKLLEHHSGVVVSLPIGLGDVYELPERSPMETTGQ